MTSIVESDMPYDIAKASDGPVFTDEVVDKISRVLSLPLVGKGAVSVPHGDRNSISWELRRGAIDLTLVSYSPDSTRTITGDAELYFRRPNRADMMGHELHHMVGISRIEVIPTGSPSRYAYVSFIRQVPGYRASLSIHRRGVVEVNLYETTRPRHYEPVGR